MGTSSQQRTHHHLQSTPTDPTLENDEENDTSRRGFLTKAFGGAALTGIVANGFAVQGPSPYFPPFDPSSTSIPAAGTSMKDKVIVVTGGNTGLGLESVERLALSGATIFLTSRSIEKGQKAVQSVKEYTKEKGVVNDNIYSLPLDLCDLNSVKAFPNLLQKELTKLPTPTVDVLLNNAGVMAIPELEITKDGYEKTFQTNHLGHFALTALLFPLLSEEARIVNVSSMAHLIASKGLDMNNLNGEVEYKPWDAYGRSKLENILFTKELQRRADAAGRKITTMALHPGAVRTDLPRYIIGEDKFVSMQDGSPTLTDELKVLPMMYFTKSVERGASTQVWLSSFGEKDDADVKGKFFFNMKEMKLGSAAMDMERAEELWKVSEEMSGVEFKL